MSRLTDAFRPDPNRTPYTSRGAKYYTEVFPWVEDDMKILNLGHGQSNLDENRVGATVVGLDIGYAGRFDPIGSGQHVAASFDTLPFPDGCFDGTTAGWSLMWANSKAAQINAVDESLRVTKTGGHFGAAPGRYRRQSRAPSESDRQKTGDVDIDPTIHTISSEIKTAHLYLSWGAIMATLAHEAPEMIGTPGLWGIPVHIGLGVAGMGSSNLLQTWNSVSVPRHEEYDDPEIRRNAAEQIARYVRHANVAESLVLNITGLAAQVLPKKA